MAETRPARNYISAAGLKRRKFDWSGRATAAAASIARSRPQCCMPDVAALTTLPSDRSGQPAEAMRE
eukprot:13253295-Alexandrium_andersonii.AAC.1